MTEPGPDQAEEIPAPAGATKKGRPKVSFFGPDGKSKFRPSAKMRDAIMEALQRKRAGYGPEYKVLAAKHTVKAASLKRFVHLYEHGQIELGAPPGAAAKKAADINVENEKTFQLLLGYEQLLNAAGEELLKKAKKELKEGNLLAFDQLGLPKIIGELKRARELRNVVEKGNFAALQELMEMEEKRRNMGVHHTEVTGPVNVTQNNVHIHPNGNGQPADPVAAAKPVGPAGHAAHLTNEQDAIRGALAGLNLASQAVPVERRAQ